MDLPYIDMIFRDFTQSIVVLEDWISLLWPLVQKTTRFVKLY